MAETPPSAPNGRDDGEARGDGAATDSAMLAFLIADIRGYTRYTQQHGDEAAGWLAAKFAVVTREIVSTNGGTLLELRGDEALVVFQSSRRAVRTAVLLQQRYVAETQTHPDQPLAVGIGVDIGEVVRVEGGYRGRALNLAARLCSAARPGEILASAQIAHLAGSTDEFRYADRPDLSAKGIDAPVAAKRVVPHGDDPMERLRALGAVPAPPPPVRRDRRPVALAIACALTLIVGITVALVGRSPASTQQSFAAGTLLFDLNTQKPITTIPASTMAAPGFELYDGSHFWVYNAKPSSFVEIDPHSGKILTQFASPTSADHSGQSTYQPYTVVGNTLWLSDGDDVAKIDIRIGRVVGRLRLDHLAGGSCTAEGVTYGDGLLWVSRDCGAGQVLGLNPRTGHVEHRFDRVPFHSDVAYADGTIWTADYNGADVIDVASGKVTRVADIEGTNRIVQAGGGFGWTTLAPKGLVYKIDTQGHVVATYQVGIGAGSATFADGTLWAAGTDEGTATGIDAITGDETTYNFGHPVASTAAGAGVLLTWLQPGQPITQIVNEQKGNVLRLFSQQGEFGDGDEPALNFSFTAQQIEYATCAKLLNYPDKPGLTGLQLRPEVAARMPTVSNHGRTYTFTVRSGYMFSPPVNQPLTAETFRYSIERAMSPKLADFTPASYYVPDIAGENAFRAGRAKHISGITANGDTLSITLTAASPDFLERLTLPFFCPVPLGTPYAGGAEAVGGDPFAGGGTIPSAGPYYIANYQNEELILLKRNPNYHGPRPQHLDAIVLREGVDANVAIGDVQSGLFDGIVSSGRNGNIQPYDTLLDPGSAVAKRYSGHGADGLQYVETPLPHIGFIALDSNRPPFDDPRVRKAAALALDRVRIAAIWQQAATAYALPPLFPGIPTKPPPAPDPAAARRLLHGSHPHVTLGSFSGCDPCAQELQDLRFELGQAGFRVEVKPAGRINDPFAPGDNLSLLDSGSGEAVPDPASVLTALIQRGLPAGWPPPSISQAAERMANLSGAARTSAAIKLAKRLASSDVVIAYGYSVQPELLRSGVGCRVVNAASYGIDLAALCRNG